MIRRTIQTGDIVFTGARFGVVTRSKWADLEFRDGSWHPRQFCWRLLPVGEALIERLTAPPAR